MQICIHTAPPSHAKVHIHTHSQYIHTHGKRHVEGKLPGTREPATFTRVLQKTTQRPQDQFTTLEKEHVFATLN